MNASDDTHISDGRLAAYQDGELSTEETARVKNHLAECSTCREGLAAMQGVSVLERERPSEALPDRVWKQIEAEVREEHRPKSGPARVVSLLSQAGTRAAAVAAAVVLIIGGLWAGGTFPSFGPSEETPLSAAGEQTLAVDYGLYLSGLRDPAEMVRFERRYGQAPLPEEQIPRAIRRAAGTIDGLERTGAYRLSGSWQSVTAVRYRHENRPITVFRQQAGQPVQFAGYETEEAVVGTTRCLLAGGERYCALSFRIGDYQYVLVGERTDPALGEIIRALTSEASSST